MTDQGATDQSVDVSSAINAAPLFQSGQMIDPSSNLSIDLDDLFNDLYYMDLPMHSETTAQIAEAIIGSSTSSSSVVPGVVEVAAPTPELATIMIGASDVAAGSVAGAEAFLPAASGNTENWDVAAGLQPPQTSVYAPPAIDAPTNKMEAVTVSTPATATFLPVPVLSSLSTSTVENSSSPSSAAVAATAAAAAAALKRSAEAAGLFDADGKELTEQQKLERRERNREHAKRSRLRKKFLLESLQEQIHGLEEQIEGFKKAIQEHLPDKAELIITNICGDKDKFTPLPMPSGFGPVKTLMEPDFRLMSALSGSQQNFAISDPTLPDNPIVYVSQGFLDLTGYTLDHVLGRNCRFLQGPGTDQSAVEVIRRGITEGVDTSVCLLNYKADGTPFWNQFFVAALRDAENNIVNYVGVQCEVSKAVVEKHMSDQKKNSTPS